MSRVTIDDEIDHDPRIMGLKLMVGEAQAYGYLIQAYRLAKSFYVPERKPIPEKLLKMLPGGPSLIETGVAEPGVPVNGEPGYFIIHSEEQFGWLITKHANGRKGGRPKETEDNLKVDSVIQENPPAPVPAPVPVPVPVPVHKKKEREEIPKSEIQECIGEWGKTLSRHKISKDPRFDETSIVGLIQRHGIEKTKLALLGAGFEEKSKDYDPSKHVNIHRLTKPDIFETFVNLGAQNQPRLRQYAEMEASC